MNRERIKEIIKENLNQAELDFLVEGNIEAFSIDIQNLLIKLQDVFFAFEWTENELTLFLEQCLQKTKDRM